MTATDLAARILAEIERRETWLRSFDDSWTSGPRTIKQHEALISLAFENLTRDTTITRDDVDAILTWVLPDADRQVMDPQVRLRRCAADRRIVARHERGVRLGEWDEETRASLEVPYCITCTMGDSCSCCVDVWEPWPCATLRDIADGYGITVDGAA